MAIFYNKELYTQGKLDINIDRHLEGYKESHPGDSFYNLSLYHAYPSKEEALNQDFSGPISFMDGDKLISSYLHQPFDYEAVEDNNIHYNHGINWSTAYCKDHSILIDAFKDYEERWDDEGMDDYGMYRIHYHH